MQFEVVTRAIVLTDGFEVSSRDRSVPHRNDDEMEPRAPSVVTAELNVPRRSGDKIHDWKRWASSFVMGEWVDFTAGFDTCSGRIYQSLKMVGVG